MADASGTSPPRRSSIQGIKDKIKKFVSSSGGDKQPRTDAARDSHPDPNKMENKLEINKANKQGDQMNEPSDVAGREDKGLGMADKLTTNEGSGLTEEGNRADTTGLGGRNY